MGARARRAERHAERERQAAQQSADRMSPPRRGATVDLSVGRQQSWDAASVSSAGSGRGGGRAAPPRNVLDLPGRAPSPGPVACEPLPLPLMQTPREKVLGMLGLPINPPGRPITDRDYHRAVRTAPDSARRPRPLTSRAQTAEGQRWRTPNRAQRRPPAP
eukprot:SAG22_NODE_1373_length_4575_cov_10.793789_5_plen_160_part_01